MHDRRRIVSGLVAAVLTLVTFGAGAVPKPRSAACRTEVFEGELLAGNAYTKLIGNGLKIWFQPIASGWILRVIPAAGPIGDHDYAELATPPYRSVSPLSLSTDFSFRAQDAVGWNPRRFRFATSKAEFERLDDVYERYIHSGDSPPAPLEVELSGQVSEASEGTLTILDARIVPGAADQWRMASAVSSHFATTAHTLVNTPDGRPSALGKLLWVRFRLELQVPIGFRGVPDVKTVASNCTTG